MSFSTETKNELARVKVKKKCCMLAEIAGFIRVSGSVRLEGSGRLRIVIATENAATARHFKALIKEYFRAESALQVEECPPPKKRRQYLLNIGPEMRSEQILRETGILLVREGNDYIADGVYPALVRSKCCKRAYLRGVFLGAGTVNDPGKGYGLEFVCGSMAFAADLRKLICSFDDLSAKIAERKGQYIVYMKKSEYVRDTLGIMEAHARVLELEKVRLEKELLGMTIRITNCDNANTDRAIEASQRQIEDIRKIESARGLDSLPEKLRDTALMRLKYPEVSLAQLGEMLDPPLKKSGVNNRFRRIGEIASRL